jgi:integrase
MAKTGLTTKRIAKLKSKPGRYHDGHKLYLQVTNENAVSWILRYQRNGKERMLGLGPLHTISLQEARLRAKKARLQLLDGIDPVEAKKAAKRELKLTAAKTMTFQECAEAYIAANRSGWKNAKHGKQWTATLATYAYPKIGDLRVADIDTGLVLKCIEPIWGAKTETASRVRGRIESVLAWATVRGYRQGDNPARWTNHLDQVLPGKGKVTKVEHHAALPWRDIRAFMAELRKREGTAARALEFTILTAARTGEVIGAKWDEIDLREKTWTVPAGRMKGGKEHRVPLSARAIELLNDLYREDGNEHLFIGPQNGGGLSNMAMTAVLKRMGRGAITVHGFRSTFMDWAHEQTNHPKVVIDLALAHTVGDKVEAAYRRGELLKKRQALADAWGRYCAMPLVESTVVPLARGKRS